MITPKCPKCHRVIPVEDNVGKDIAFCRACGLAHSFTGLLANALLDTAVDFSCPPTGVWYRSGGRETVIGASHRSWGGALGALAFSLFWNGILSLFVLLAVGSTLHHFGFTLPDHFPAPKMTGDDMRVGMTIFLWLFLTPFMVIGVGMVGAFFFALFGRTEVRIRNGEGVVYIGIGPLGYRRRFNPAEVKEVRLHDQSWQDSDGDQRRETHIIIEENDGKLLKFGCTLREERRLFVAAATREALDNGAR